MMLETVGFCATFLGTIKTVPQFLKIHSSDDVNSFSKESLLLGILATLLWIWYAIKKKSYCMLTASIGGLLYEIYILVKITKPQLKDFA